MLLLRILIVLFILWNVFLTSASCKGLSFSSDGEILITSDEKQPSFSLISLSESLRDRQVFVPKEITQDGGPNIILNNGQELLIASKSKLWSLNIDKVNSSLEHIANLPNQFVPHGLVIAKGDKLSNVILLSGYHVSEDGKPALGSIEKSQTFYSIIKGQNAFEAVFVRYLHDVGLPAFKEERMFFPGDGEIWEGNLEDPSFTDEPSLALSGNRIAPLAYCEVTYGIDGPAKVDEIVVAGDNIFASLVGNHLGALVSVPIPKKNQDLPLGLEESWKIQSEQLAKAKIFRFGSENSETTHDFITNVSCLTSWNGSQGNWKVAFYVRDSLWLIDSKDPKPSKIR